MEKTYNIAIVGGGKLCSLILDAILKDNGRNYSFKIVGIAECDPPCIKKAKELDIYTTDNYKDILKIRDLDMIIELSGDSTLRDKIISEKSSHISLIDKNSAEFFWELAIIEAENLHKEQWDKKIKAVSGLFNDLIRLEQEKMEIAQEMKRKIKAEKDFTMSILNNLPDAVLVLNDRLETENANSTFVNEFNLKDASITGKKCFELIHNRNERCPSNKCPISYLERNEQKSVHTEMMIKRQEGELYYEVHVEPIADYERSERFLFTFINITNRKQLELELKRSREKYRKLFLDAKDGIILFDKNGVILEANVSLYRMLSYSINEITKMKIWELGHGTSRKILSDHLEDLQLMGYVPIEMDFCRKDGTVLPVEVSLLYLSEEDIFQAIVRDITIRKKLEKAQKQYSEQLEREVEKRTHELRESQKEIMKQKRYAEGIIYGSPIPMFVLDKNHRITYWNKACERLTGYTAEEMIGTDNQWMPFYPQKRPLLADLVIEGDIEGIHRLYDSMNLRESPMVEGAYEAEHYFPHLGPNGTHLYFNAAPIKDENDTVQGAIVTYQDFSERVRMTQEIKRREMFVRNLIENSIDGIIATDKEGKIVIFNRAASEMLGFNPDEIIGKISYKEILSPEMTKKVRKAFYGKEWGPKGKIINMEAEIINIKGEPIPVRFSGTLLHQKGKEVGSVVFIQDLREILRLQKEKEQAERLAAIGQTVAGLAHYIKNILNGLQGGAYVINSALKKSDMGLIEKGLKMMNKNIDQITNIVMDMLVYSKERRPKYEFVDPNELTKDVIELMQERARLANVELIPQLSEGISPVPMDRTAIHRCLLNLVSNAIDACTLEGIMMGNGKVTIRTFKPQGWAVGFEVIDNGTGMDEETQKRLFTGFFSTKGYKGTGLGLPVTQKIVKEHGGELSFVSSPRKGTKFTLLLPEKDLDS